MKITRGIYKRKNIVVAPGVRPVLERVREACFNMVRDIVPDAAVLDLFAGSGALGLEALSCGAKTCLFIDNSKSALDAVTANIEALGVFSAAKTAYGDAFEKIKELSLRKYSFDLVFLDPPYGRDSLSGVLQRLVEYDIVCPFGFLVGFCAAYEDIADKYGDFSQIANKKYGQTRVLIYEKGDLSGNL